MCFVFGGNYLQHSSIVSGVGVLSSGGAKTVQQQQQNTCRAARGTKLLYICHCDWTAGILTILIELVDCGALLSETDNLSQTHTEQHHSQ